MMSGKHGDCLKRLYVVFSNDDGTTELPDHLLRRVYGPYRIVDVVPDGIFVTSSVRQPNQLTVAVNGGWAVLDGFGHDSPTWKSFKVVSPQSNYPVEDLYKRGMGRTP
jgi:hypothetical protein